MAISAVGSAYTNHGLGVTTVASVNPTTIGDVLAVYVGYASVSPAVSGLSHSGVTTWVNATRFTGNAHGSEVALGVITATGSATLTVSFSPSNSGISTMIGVQQFTIGSAATWAVDGSQANGTSGSGATGTYPSLTPAGSGELYFGGANCAGTMSAGSTSGFTYSLIGTNASIAYNTTASGATQPTQPAGGGAWSTAAAFIIGTVIVATGDPGAPWLYQPFIPILPSVPVGV